MQLLSGDFLHMSIRNFAVSCLRNSSYLDIKDCLIQLVQSLRYEMYHDSNLARYLLMLAVKFPLTIGHDFFWILKSEMNNPGIRNRFGLYLEVFLKKIGKEVRDIFADECWLLSKLMIIADIPKSKKSEDERKRKYKEALENLNKMIDKEYSLPLDFKKRISGINVDKCKFMKSKKRPLWLVFSVVVIS